MTKKEKNASSSTSKPQKSSLGLAVNTASALCYGTGFLPYFGWLSGLLFIFFEKDKGIRFHALQSLAVFGSIAALQFLFTGTYIFGKLLSLIYVGQFILWLILIYRTYNEDHWILPYVGKWAAKQIK